MLPTGSVKAGLQPASHPVPGERVKLARDLSDLLVEFSLALGHQSAYPEGHPLLVTAAERLTHALAGVLVQRSTLTLGIARRQFVIDGIATDPGNGLLGNLAQRFHRHRVAALRFERGITRAEIGSLLSALGTDPRRDPGPLGLQPKEVHRWAHAELYAAQYHRLELSEDPESEAESRTEAQEIQLWLELARAALPEGSETDLADDGQPGVLAAAINQRPREVSYDQTVVSYLMRVAEEVGVGETVEQAWLRRRLSRLIASLQPAALERLLQEGCSDSSRQRFVLAASQTLAADAVLKVVEAASESSNRHISDSLVLLLRKLAQHAESEQTTVATAADDALRENVGRLLADWSLDDPNPEAYASVLQQMARNTRSRLPLSGPEPDFGVDPEQVLRIGLEVGEAGPRVHAAAEGLVVSGRTRLLTDLLAEAAGTGTDTEAIWGRVATPELLSGEVARQPVDFTVVDALVARLGAGAADPLLDALAVSDDRSTRWNLLRILAELGAPIAPAVAARLPDPRWFVQRNLLLLLGKLGPWPEGFSPAPYISHVEPRVRREAYRLLLDSTVTRDAAIVDGLSDTDSGILTMVLKAAQPTCPAPAIPLLEAVVRDTSRNLEVRLLAVRGLAGCPDPDRVTRLITAAKQRTWWGGTRLAPKSPVFLAVLRALADNCAHHPEAASVLALAARHRDPEIRAAGGPTPR